MNNMKASKRVTYMRTLDMVQLDDPHPIRGDIEFWWEPERPRGTGWIPVVLHGETRPALMNADNAALIDSLRKFETALHDSGDEANSYLLVRAILWLERAARRPLPGTDSAGTPTVAPRDELPLYEMWLQHARDHGYGTGRLDGWRARAALAAPAHSEAAYVYVGDIVSKSGRAEASGEREAVIDLEAIRTVPYGSKLYVELRGGAR